MRLIPDGTRFTLPPEWEWRENLRTRLETVLSAWGYEAVQTPSLEVYDPNHPQAEKSFKLVDRDGTVLALRGEYTTAISNLVRANFPNGPFPLRLRYAGQLWTRARDAELGRQREFTQVGAELMGVSTALADSEVVVITVANVNRAPVLAVIGAKNVNEGVLLTFNDSATDPDGTIPTMTALTVPSGATFVNNANGTGTFTWTPNFTQSGVFNVTFIASDGTRV